MVSTTKYFLATVVINNCNLFCPEKSCHKKENRVKKHKKVFKDPKLAKSFKKYGS